MAAMKFNNSAFRGKMQKWMQENATGILGTIAFHMFLAVIFLMIKISSEKSYLDSIILLDLDEASAEEQLEEEKPDPGFDQRLADYLEQASSNVPVNLARNVEDEISTEKYVQDLEQEMNDNRPESWEEMQERLKELKELKQEELIVDGEDDAKPQETKDYQGPTNIYYSLKNRHHMRLPVPVYKCEGSGLIEVGIVVDQRGRVIHAEVDQQGGSLNEICLAEAAKNAALRTRFNTDYKAATRQAGTITYHFIAQ
jgi:hypothetical protein